MDNLIVVFCVGFFSPCRCYTNTNSWKLSWHIRFFNPATIRFSAPRLGVGNNPLTQTTFSLQTFTMTFLCKLCSVWKTRKGNLAAHEQRVFSKAHRWEKVIRDSCWLWHGFLGAVHVTLTWALQPTTAYLAPASVSSSGPGAGMDWKTYWDSVLINHLQGQECSLGAGVENQALALSKKNETVYLFFLKVAVPKPLLANFFILW